MFDRLTYPFEIHVTVRSPDLDAFRSTCTEMGVKPIVLDLQDREGTTVLTDVMTSQRLQNTTTEGAMLCAAHTAQKLREAGYDVVRTKVESVPWHYQAPQRSNTLAMPVNSYFESHIQIATTEDRLGELREIAKQTDAHLSRNIFKRDGDKVIIMMTLREHDAEEESFVSYVKYVAAKLRYDGFDVRKEEVEFCVFDSAKYHDKEWTGA